MAITKALVKRFNTFDLKKISETEENYIAWQVADSFFNSTVGDVGTLSSSSSGNTSIGSHTDTSFDQAVGSHPSSSLTTTTTTTNLYQNFGADATVSDVYPTINTNNTIDFKAPNASEFDTILDRVIEKVFGDAYFDYRLASDTPVGYTLYISSVFSDTRADGANVVYNIYKKNLPTKPTIVRPLKSVGSDFRTMTDTEIKECFAQRIKNKISNSSIGSYELRSSAQGAPSGGTWVSLGTAADTKQDTANNNYSRTSTRTGILTSTRESTQNFTRQTFQASAVAYTGNYTRSRDSTIFAAQFTRTSSRTSIAGSPSFNEVEFIGNFLGNFTGNFAGNFTGNYTRSRAVDYTRTSTRTSTRTEPSRVDNFNGVISYYGSQTVFFAGNFVGNFVVNFTGNYTRVSTRSSTRSFVTDFLGNYLGNFEGGFVGNYEGNFVGNYDATDYTSSFVGNYEGVYTGNFAGDFVGDYEGNFVGNYEGNYLGNFVGNYAGLTIQSSSSQIEIYTLYHRIA